MSIRKQWSAEAKARHMAGVKRYQKEREIQKHCGMLYDTLEDYSKQEGYDLQCTIDAYFILLKNLSEASTDKKYKHIDFEDYFKELIRQKQSERSIALPMPV